MRHSDALLRDFSQRRGICRNSKEGNSWCKECEADLYAFV